MAINTPNTRPGGSANTGGSSQPGGSVERPSVTPGGGSRPSYNQPSQGGSQQNWGGSSDYQGSSSYDAEAAAAAAAAAAAEAAQKQWEADQQSARRQKDADNKAQAEADAREKRQKEAEAAKRRQPASSDVSYGKSSESASPAAVRPSVAVDRGQVVSGQTAEADVTADLSSDQKANQVGAEPAMPEPKMPVGRPAEPKKRKPQRRQALGRGIQQIQSQTTGEARRTSGGVNSVFESPQESQAASNPQRIARPNELEEDRPAPQAQEDRTVFIPADAVSRNSVDVEERTAEVDEAQSRQSSGPSFEQPRVEERSQEEEADQSSYNEVDARMRENAEKSGPWTEQNTAERAEKREQSVKYAERWFKSAPFKFSGDKVKKEVVGGVEMEFVEHSKELEEAIEATCEIFGANPKSSRDHRMVLTAGAMLYGITPDRKDRLFLRKDSMETPIDDGMMIDALRQLRRNVADPVVGQPLQYSFSGNAFFHKSERFPLCVPTKELADWMGEERPGSRCRYGSESIMRFGVNQWMNVVRNDIVSRASDSQRAVLLDAMDAIERINGTNEAYSGRTGNGFVDGDFTTQDIFNPDIVDAMVYADKDSLLAANKTAAERMQQYVTMAKKRERNVTVDENGNVVNSYEKYGRGVNDYLKMFANTVRAFGLMDFVYGVASIPQHAMRNFEQKVAIKAMYARNGIEDIGTAEGKRSLFNKLDSVTFDDQFINSMKSKAFKDAMDDLIAGYAMGNREGLMASLADPNARLGSFDYSGSFLEKWRKMSRAERGEYMAKHGTQELLGFAAKLSSGRGVMSMSDNKRFMEMLWAGIQQEPGNVMTFEQFQQSFVNDPARFLTDMAKRPAGNDAVLFTLDNTLSGMNVVSEPVQRVMARNGLTSVAIMTFISKYPTYGMNLTGWLLPMSRTFNYLAARGLSKYTKNDTRWQDLAIGGSSEFRNGLWNNVVMDLATLGVRGAGIALAVGILSLLGLEPPDDEEKILVPGEWKILGEAIKPNWYLSDVFGPIFYTAIPVLAYVQGKVDVAQAKRMFVEGQVEVMAGTPWMKMSTLYQNIVQFDELEKTEALLEAEYRDQMFQTKFEELINDPEWMAKTEAEQAELPEDQRRTATEVAMEKAEAMAAEMYDEWEPGEWTKNMTKLQTWGLSTLSNFFCPPMITNLYNESGWLSSSNYAKSTTQVYTDDPTDDPDRTETTSWADSQFRTVARRNPLAAVILNTVNAVKGGSEGKQVTGYLKGEMPDQVWSDPTNQYWQMRFAYSPAMSESQKTEIVEDVMSVIDMFDSAEEMAAYGIVIPKDTQQLVSDYCYSNINDIRNQQKYDFAYDSRYVSNGYTSDWNWTQRNQRQADDNVIISKLYDYANKMKAGGIPQYAYTYKVWDTNYRSSYLDSEGNPVTSLEYLGSQILGTDDVSKNMYASGDHKSSYSPLEIVDQQYNTYDEQTPAGWFVPGLTDLAKAEQLYSNVEYFGGMYIGETVWDVMSGGGMVTMGNGENWSMTLLSGSRALVPEKKYNDTWVEGFDRDDAWDPTGSKDFEEPDSTSGGKSYGYGYGGYSRSYGGGSSYTYNPKIYSNPAYSLSADKPATMYSKIPYSTTFDYLYPGFETKGSREAYKRQDI